ncbi:MAG: hypothetical protein HYY17_01580 [Planctomycetes bacterium]|nr:hypothetical protein [Planctomycetota bacterium]
MAVVSAEARSSPAPEVAAALARFFPDLARREPETASTLWGWVAAQSESVQADLVRNIPSVDEVTNTVLLGMARRAETRRLVQATVRTMLLDCEESRRAIVVARLTSEPRLEIRFEAIVAIERAAASQAIDRDLAKRTLEGLVDSDSS